MIYIGNLRKKYKDGILQIIVDRSSPLGNPFIMEDESQRDSVCDLYEKWLYRQINHEIEKICNELNRIAELAKTQDIRLMCWCSPKRCHAETIKEYIEKSVV